MSREEPTGSVGQRLYRVEAYIYDQYVWLATLGAGPRDIRERFLALIDPQPG